MFKTPTITPGPAQLSSATPLAAAGSLQDPWLRNPPVDLHPPLHCGMCQHGADHLREFGSVAVRFQKARVAQGMEHLHPHSRGWLTGAEVSHLNLVQTNGRLFNMYVTVCASD